MDPLSKHVSQGERKCQLAESNPPNELKKNNDEPIQADESAFKRTNLPGDYLFLFSIAGLVLALDQYTKSLVRETIAIGELWAPWDWLLPYARIVNAYNTGAAFGILKNFGGVFTVLAIVVAIAIMYYFPQVPRNEMTLRFALSLQLGGALGNLTDRLVRTYVTDFISIWNFPVFNVADASIFIGVIILALGMWKNERQLASAGSSGGEQNDALKDDSSPEVTRPDSGEESFGA